VNLEISKFSNFQISTFQDCCPKCHCDDRSMLEVVADGRGVSGFCNNCAHEWAIDGRRHGGVRHGEGDSRDSEEGLRNEDNSGPAAPVDRFRSVEDLIARTGVNREELSVLAEIGALNAFGYTRREALWQIERAIRPAGELFEASPDPSARPLNLEISGISNFQISQSSNPESSQSSNSQILKFEDSAVSCPLPSMTAVERVVADYEGTGLTIGPHPMALRRAEMSLRGALRACDLPRQRHGRRVRVAGAVITRQRPGTAKGFVFLTLEDETGIANIIVRPDLFAAQRVAVIEEPFLLVEGMLQNQDGVTAVRAEQVSGIGGTRVDVESRDFY
jgi:error-prone DNA polymerase